MKRILKWLLWGVLFLSLLLSAAWFVGSAYVKGKLVDAVTKNGGSFHPKNLTFGGFPFGYEITLQGLQIDTVYKKAKVTGNLEKLSLSYTFFLPFRVSLKGENAEITLRPLQKKEGHTLHLKDIQSYLHVDKNTFEIKESHGDLKGIRIVRKKLPAVHLEALSFDVESSPHLALETHFEGLSVEGLTAKNNPFFPIQKGNIALMFEKGETLKGKGTFKTGVSTYLFEPSFVFSKKGMQGSLKIYFKAPYQVLKSVLENRLFDIPMRNLFSSVLKQKYEKKPDFETILHFQNGYVDYTETFKKLFF